MHFNPIWQMALKDIRLITRDRLGLFFIAVFPIMMGLFFGSIMGGMGDSKSSGKIRIAVVDEDQSPISKTFIESLKRNEQIEVSETKADEGKESVRRGNRTAVLVLPAGFGRTAGIFWETPPTIDIGIDPSRQAEGAMVEGFIMQSLGDLVGKRFQYPGEMKGLIDKARGELAGSELSVTQRGLIDTLLMTVNATLSQLETIQEQDSEIAARSSGGLQFADFHYIDVSKTVEPGSREALISKIRSGWDISFPQAMLWGVLSCAAGFAISIARERTLGTLIRLQVAPVSRLDILLAKGLACFLTVLAVIGMLTLIGVALGMRPASYPKMLVAAVCVAWCFVGIMMVVSVIAKTEQGVSGAGWGLNMIMAMLGGCMIPAVFLPGILQKASALSPVRWSIESLEGAIWRQYSWSEMILPCTVLLSVGLVCFLIGSRIMQRR